MTSGVSRDGDYVVMRIHKDDIFAIRVGLRCPCGATKSIETEKTRQRFDRALAYATRSK